VGVTDKVGAIALHLRRFIGIRPWAQRVVTGRITILGGRRCQR